MIEVVGLTGVLAGMSGIEAEIELHAKPEGLARAAEHLKQAWQDNIAGEGFLEYTGHYHDSVMVTLEGSEAAVHTEVPYAGILEFGDSRQEAHPVAERAFDEHNEEATAAVGDAVREVVR